MMNRKTGLGLAAVVAVSAAAVPGLALTHAVDASTAAAPSNNEAVVLAAAIRQELDHLPATASAQDIEGSIVFALSQKEYTHDVIASALATLRADPNATPQLRTALTNVQLALLRRPNRGTAAINGGGGFSGTGGTSFSPLLGPGGGGNGSSNYAT